MVTPKKTWAMSEQEQTPLEKVFAQFQERFRATESISMASRLMTTREVAQLLGEVLGKEPEPSTTFRLLTEANYTVNFNAGSKPVWLFVEV